MSTTIDFPPSGEKMPVLFVGHGSPMNAVEDNEFSRAWADVGRSLPRPRAVLCVSAHWETRGTRVTSVENPGTIHDFHGFPRELYAARYPAPGSPPLARLLGESVELAGVHPDGDRGLDHGAWSVLCRLFPSADIPVVQVSLDGTQPPPFHYELGRALRPLRDRGVLIVGSGNIVHNLGEACRDEGPGGSAVRDWALEFDERVRRLILEGDHLSVVRYELLGRAARLSVPTNEHYLPLLYALGLRDEGEVPRFFAEKTVLCSISMRSMRFG